MILIKKGNYGRRILIGGAVGLGLEALLGLVSYSSCSSSSQGGGLILTLKLSAFAGGVIGLVSGLIKGEKK